MVTQQYWGFPACVFTFQEIIISCIPLFFSSLQLYRKLKSAFFFFPFPGRDLRPPGLFNPPSPPVCDWPVGSVRAQRRVASGLLVFQELQPPLVVLRRVHVSVGSRGRFPGRLSLLYQAAALQARQKQRRTDEISLAWGNRRECSLCSSAAIRIDTHVFFPFFKSGHQQSRFDSPVKQVLRKGSKPSSEKSSS